MVISKWITINLSWKQFVPLSVWSGFLRCWLFRIQGKRVLQQASRAERPLPGLLPTCAHSSYEEPVRGKARGPAKSDSSSRDRTAQLAGAERPQDQQVLACHPCQAQAAGCPGLGSDSGRMSPHRQRPWTVSQITGMEVRYEFCICWCCNFLRGKPQD